MYKVLKAIETKKDTDSLCVVGEKDTFNFLNHSRLSLYIKISVAFVLKCNKLYFILYMANTLNMETLCTACVLNQSDKIPCPYPSELCKGLPSSFSCSCLWAVGPSLHPLDFPSFNFQLNHHPLHNPLLYPPLLTPEPAINNLFLLYSHST